MAAGDLIGSSADTKRLLLNRYVGARTCVGVGVDMGGRGVGYSVGWFARLAAGWLVGRGVMPQSGCLGGEADGNTVTGAIVDTKVLKMACASVSVCHL